MTFFVIFGILLWAGTVAMAYYVGLSVREEDVISSYERRIRRDAERLAARKARTSSDVPRVRDAKIRSTRRGYLGEEVEDDS